MQSYATFPSTPSIPVEPFQVSVPDPAVNEFRELLRLSRVAKPTFENQSQDGSYGISRDWIVSAKEKWLSSYDWRATESRINEYPAFLAQVKDEKYDEDIAIHFTGLFSKKKDAVAIILLHGWPDNFLEFLPLLKLFKDEYTPETLPYHLIVPSLPGTAFSAVAPLHRNLTRNDVTRLMHGLMSGLGFGSGYLVHGGSFGGYIAYGLAAHFPDAVKAVHLNNGVLNQPTGVEIDEKEYTLEEVAVLARRMKFRTTGGAYAIEHATRPSTAGLALSTNPLSLLAWIGEKYIEWSDEKPPLELILDSASLYWFTECFPTGLYPYREFVQPELADNSLEKLGKTPFGYSWFPVDMVGVPKSWIAGTFNLVFFRRHQSGGHFPNFEKPEALKQDLIDFFGEILKN